MEPDIAATPNQPEAVPVFPIPAVYLLHGKGGSPDGTVKKLQTIVEQHWPGLEFVRPRLLHHNPGIPAEESVRELLRLEMPGRDAMKLREGIEIYIEARQSEGLLWTKGAQNLRSLAKQIGDVALERIKVNSVAPFVPCFCFSMAPAR